MPVPCEEGGGDGDPLRRSCVLTFDFDRFRSEKCSEREEKRTLKKSAKTNVKIVPYL